MTTINLDQVKEIPLSELNPDPHNVRKTFDTTELAELAADIKLRGVMQPITITRNGKGYDVKHGERRYLAAKSLKQKTIRCILTETDPNEKQVALARLCDQFADNMQRVDLNVFEKGVLVASIRDRLKIKITKIPEVLAERGIHYDRATLSNFVRLLALPQWAKELIIAGKLSQYHGRIILPAMKSKASMKSLEKELLAYFKKPEEDRLEWPMTHDDLKSLIDKCYSRNHVKVNSWEKPIPYDIDKLDAATKEKLNVVDVDDGTHQPEKYILNTALHQKLIQQVKDGKIPKVNDGRAQDPTKKVTAKDQAKSEPKTEASAGRLRDWLHRYLIKWNDAKIADLPAAKRRTLYTRLFFWYVNGAPARSAWTRYISHYSLKEMEDYLIDRNDNGICNQVHKATGVDSLISALKSKKTINQVMDIIVPKFLHCIDIDDAGTLAKTLGFNYLKHITIDDDFAVLYTGSGINKIVTEASAGRLRDWLHRYLIKWNDAKIADLPAAKRRTLYTRLFFWYVNGAPARSAWTRYISHYSLKEMEDYLIDRNDNGICNQVHKATGVDSLISALKSKKTVNQVMDIIVPKFLHCIDIDDAGTLAKTLGFNYLKHITIDNDFAVLYTGSGINKIVKAAKLTADPAWSAIKMKATEKKAFAVKHAKTIGTTKATAAAFKKYVTLKKIKSARL